LQHESLSDNPAANDGRLRKPRFVVLKHDLL
jgi:hypothetical protein